MYSNPDVIILDVRGEVCPSPLIRAMEAMRTAGKGQGGAFDNDDDWKKEVKALFGESCPTPLFWRVFR